MRVGQFSYHMPSAEEGMSLEQVRLMPDHIAEQAVINLLLHEVYSLTM